MASNFHTVQAIALDLRIFFADSLSTMPTNINHPSFFLCIPLINVRLQKGANKSVDKLYCYITVNIKCAMDTIIHILFTYITAIIICLRSPCQSLIINNFRYDIMIAQGKFLNCHEALKMQKSFKEKCFDVPKC